MNKQIVVLLCSSSFVVACGGGSDNRPAQSAYDPQTTSATTETAPTPMTTPPAATIPTPEPTAPSTMGTSPGQTYPSTNTSGPTGSGWGNGSTGSSSSPSNMTGSSASTGSGTTGSASNTPSATPPPAATAPDNSGVNKRDKNSGAVTPMDQGTSDGERRITANIRKLVVADKSLSFTAKNVKIITVGTKVTLRGPVKSDQEKTAIESYARGIAGVTEVDDQLEVKK